MEFKVLVYIIIGIAWLLSKLLSAKGKQGKGGNVFPESWTKPFEDQLEPVKPLARERTKIKHQEKPVKATISPNMVFETVNIPESGSQRKLSHNSDNIVVSQVQILEEIKEKETNNFAQELSYEIKNGQFDWKRAMVINELIKHQHFRW
jgi:hypothetical protein